MHELSIAVNIMEAVQQQLPAADQARLKAIGLRIGELTDVVPEALTFGFEVATRDTPFGHARLEIEQVPIIARCRRCHEETPVERFVFICSHCGSTDVEIVQGQELDIVYFDIDDTATTPPPDTATSQVHPPSKG